MELWINTGLTIEFLALNKNGYSKLIKEEISELLISLSKGEGEYTHYITNSLVSVLGKYREMTAPAKPNAGERSLMDDDEVVLDDNSSATTDATSSSRKIGEDKFMVSLKNAIPEYISQLSEASPSELNQTHGHTVQRLGSLKLGIVKILSAVVKLFVTEMEGEMLDIFKAVHKMFELFRHNSFVQVEYEKMWNMVLLMAKITNEDFPDLNQFRQRILTETEILKDMADSASYEFKFHSERIIRNLHLGFYHNLALNLKFVSDKSSPLYEEDEQYKSLSDYITENEHWVNYIEGDYKEEEARRLDFQKSLEVKKQEPDTLEINDGHLQKLLDQYNSQGKENDDDEEEKEDEDDLERGDDDDKDSSDNTGGRYGNTDAQDTQEDMFAHLEEEAAEKNESSDSDSDSEEEGSDGAYSENTFWSTSPMYTIEELLGGSSQ